MRARTMVTALGIIGLLASGGAALALDVEQWDQKRVTEAAAEFDLAVKDLLDSARLAQNEAMTRKNTIFLIVQDLKALKRFSGRLVRQLQEGEGQAETAVLLDRIGVLSRDIRAKKDMVPILEDSQRQLDTAREKLLKLAAFYGEDPLP